MIGSQHGVVGPARLFVEQGVGRGGAANVDPFGAQALGGGRKDVSLLEVPAMAISSTDCRARVAKGDPIWYLVPDGVVRYIDKRELYRGE